MKPRDVPAEIERINRGEPPIIEALYGQSGPTEASDTLRLRASNFARAMSDGVRRNAFTASNDLLNDCLPPDEELDNIVVYRTPPIAVYEAEIAEFGLRRVTATLDAIIPKRYAPNDRRLPGLGSQSTIKRGDYRIWAGIAYEGDDDPLKDYLESFRLSSEWGKQENCVDIQRLTVNEDASGPDNPGTTIDYAPWLQWMLERAADPANAPELHTKIGDFDDAFFDALDAAAGDS